MKRFIPALLLLFAVPAHGATRTAASCFASDVQAAITASANGDTVLVPGGTCTWDTSTNQVTISASHQVTLNGQGITTINWGGSGSDFHSIGALVITAGTANNTRVTGFTFNGAYINGSAPVVINTAYSPVTQTFRFDNNTMNYTINPQGTFIVVNGNGPGLIDDNFFFTTSGATELLHIMGEGAGNTTSWNEDVIPGGSQMIFIEHNTLTYPGFFNGSQTLYFGTEIVVHQGARAVVRYNTFNMIQIDVHGDQQGTCGTVNGRWLEAYNNTFHTTGTNPNVSQFMSIGGGSGVVFNNIHPSGDPTNVGTGNIQFRNNCGVGAYPILDQVGLGINQHFSPVYLWNNTNLPVNSASSYVVLNRDYFVSAGQPTTLTRCQSAADVSAGCPVSYNYTPFTYPHPLTGSVPVLTLSPSPVAFGNQNVSTTSAPITVTVANTGTANELLATPHYALTGTNPGDFPRTGGSCADAATIPAGSSCTDIFSFTPQATGARSATLTINGTVSGTDSLTGTGTAAPIPVVQLGPRTTNFGTINTGTSSGTTTYTLTNIGTATLNITSIASSDNTHFPVSGNTCGLTLSAGISCIFNASFAPVAAGLQNATLTVTTNASSSPDLITLSGTGFTPVVNPPPAPAPVIFIGATLPPQPIISNVVLSGTCAVNNKCIYVMSCSQCSANTVLFIDGFQTAQSYLTGSMTYTAKLSPGIHVYLAVNLQ